MASEPTSPRKVPMRVICPGLSRTGTGSMQAALEKLGYTRCWHGWEMMNYPKECKEFLEAAQAKARGEKNVLTRADFDRLLADFQAVTDIPCNFFWEELVEAYPEAKVVLVERDIEAWYTSFDEAVLTGPFTPQTTFIANYVEPLLGGYSAQLTRTVALQQMDNAADPSEARRNARSAYRALYARVRATVPRERLLEFRLEDGWEPLCAFLGDDVPGEEFPRVNEAEALKAKVAESQRGMLAKAGARVGGLVVPAVAVALVGVYWFRRGR